MRTALVFLFVCFTLVMTSKRSSCYNIHSYQNWYIQASCALEHSVVGEQSREISQPLLKCYTPQCISGKQRGNMTNWFPLTGPLLFINSVCFEFFHPVLPSALNPMPLSRLHLQTFLSKTRTTLLFITYQTGGGLLWSSIMAPLGREKKNLNIKMLMVAV